MPDRLARPAQLNVGSYHDGVGSAGRSRAPAPPWTIAVPSHPGRATGVAMAGFSGRADEPLDIQLVPHPAVTVLFDLGELPILMDDSSGGQHRERVVAGLAPEGARGRGETGTFACLQVRLSPLAAHAVLGASSELGGTLVALDELWGRDAVRIHEELRRARSWDERFAIADAALARRQEDGRTVDPETALAWQRIQATQGQLRVEPLAASIGWSRRRLWSRFRSQVGLSPKRAAELVRFDHAAHRLAAGHPAAVVAAESGYADQSHLHREVAAFTGSTPATLAAAPFLAVDDAAWANG